MEGNGWFGGKAAVHEEAGFSFDMGPTILTMPRVLAPVFAQSGRDMADDLDMCGYDPQRRCLYDDGTVLDPMRLGRTRRSTRRATCWPCECRARCRRRLRGWLRNWASTSASASSGTDLDLERPVCVRRSGQGQDEGLRPRADLSRVAGRRGVARLLGRARACRPVRGWSSGSVSTSPKRTSHNTTSSSPATPASSSARSRTGECRPPIRRLASSGPPDGRSEGARAPDCPYCRRLHPLRRSFARRGPHPMIGEVLLVGLAAISRALAGPGAMVRLRTSPYSACRLGHATRRRRSPP